MESFFNRAPNVSINVKNDSSDLKRAVYDFVCRIERISPYRSCVSFNLIQNESGEFTARLEVTSNSLEILLTKKNFSFIHLINEFNESFDDKLKPWLEGRFSA